LDGNVQIVQVSMNRFDLSNRLVEFAVSTCRLAVECSRDRVTGHITVQLTRCGTAPAAHYAEAVDAESRRDFIHKMKLALKELRESLVWLQIVERLGLTQGQLVHSVIAECNELTAIFVAGVATARGNSRTDD
jgi:four helix bundle protein